MSLTALPNTAVLPAWNRLARAVEGLRIVGGDGINLVQTRGGIVINQDRRAPAFQGAWYVSAAGQGELRVARGYVNGLERSPIKGPISDPDCTLQVPKAKDAAKQRWVCLKVRVDDKGKITNPAKPTEDDLTIVISDTGPKYAGETAEHPLACLYQEKIWQIAFFDYQHMTRVRGKRITHFLSPA